MSSFSWLCSSCCCSLIMSLMPTTPSSLHVQYFQNTSLQSFEISNEDTFIE
ncbi:hypothetical protein GLYMA_13G285751v4 [Glycine max]|nr:hypothetical protein GLYMA_13G285751v4 [Glycine max]KAH1103866.1 hypothetical protein GYH30_037671 [Glycine max]